MCSQHSASIGTWSFATPGPRSILKNFFSHIDIIVLSSSFFVKSQCLRAACQTSL